MKITGNTRPLTNTEYSYTIFDATGKPTVLEWRIEYQGEIKATNKVGKFKFHSSYGGKNVKLIAIVIQNGRKVGHSINLSVLPGNPKILLLEWQDYENNAIGNRKVGYLDKLKLCIKTVNIPEGDTLKISVFEDDLTKDRPMGTYISSAVNENGVTYHYLKQLSLYQAKLNKMDLYDEDEHEYYVKVEYHGYINRTEEEIQLKIQNKMVQLVKAKPTNSPVVVDYSDKDHNKNTKKGISATFNMFFDGTMNNMTNTTERKNKTSVYYGKNNPEDDSYTNYYSNVALLFMNNTFKNEEDIIKIYTEGIGTADKKKDQEFPGGALGTGIAIYMRGIKDKVQRGITQMQEKATEKYFSRGKTIDSVTINVFGFSRGAAAARYFLSQEGFIQLALKLKDKKKIKFNFIGLFDTVASYGVLHLDDVIELQLNLKGKPAKVVQLAAADEYRSNFKLTNITSSIKAGVGYQLTMPGVHSDIGGGYSETMDEKRYLGEHMVHGDDDSYAIKEFEKIKQQYINEGWYKEGEFIIEKDMKTNFSKLGKVTISNLYKLYGYRRGIPNSYQYIPFAIMKKFSEKYANMKFKDKTDSVYDVNHELISVKSQLYNYAMENDGINALRVTLPHNDLLWVRNRYLHRSNEDDSTFMGGRYVDGKPERDILEG